MSRLALTQVGGEEQQTADVCRSKFMPERYAADECTSRIAARRSVIEKNRILLHQGQHTPQICDDVIYADIRLTV